MRMTLYLRVPLCGLLQSVTVGSKVGSAVAAHAVNGREETEEEEEEERDTQVGGFGLGGWYDTHTHTRMYTHTQTHDKYMCTYVLCVKI